MAAQRDSFRRARLAGIAVVLSLVIFVVIVDAIDGLFLGDHYHPDATLYTLLAGLTATFLLGEGIGALAGRAGKRDDDDG